MEGIRLNKGGVALTSSQSRKRDVTAKTSEVECGGKTLNAPRFRLAWFGAACPVKTPEDM
ncbi:hypothetical protein NEUTE2DRAFT_126595 [Neurospora tetrasperma FGSC 2509]|nr:hypothetical protein NEUTE2DRAFT_126595 [Neurospora tetrasperma FGSC 2509]